MCMLSAAAGEIAKPNTPAKPLPAGAGDEAIAHLDKLRNAKGDLRTAEIRRNMQVCALTRSLYASEAFTCFGKPLYTSKARRC